MIARQAFILPHLSASQVALALEHINFSSSQPLRDELILWLGFFAGLSPHEICALSLDAMFDASGHVARGISIDRRAAKYGPVREIPMPRRVREALIRFRTAYPDATSIRDVIGERTSAELREWLRSTYAAIGKVEPSGPLDIRLLAPVRHASGSSRTELTAASQNQSVGLPKARSDSGKRASFRHADIVRAANAAQRAGLKVTATEISSDGSIRLSHEAATPTSAGAYDEWKERRDARRT